MKLPAIQLYVGDWIRDSIAGCSLGAQGLWLRMMFLMHDSERYGYLQVGGKPMSYASIAKRCGCDEREFTSLLLELTSAGVPRVTEGDIIYSKRLVEDQIKREKWRKRQRKFRAKVVHNSGTIEGKAKELRHGAVTPMSRLSSSSLSLSSSLSNKEVGGTRIFVKPTATELTLYAESISFALDAQRFLDFYESKGWMIGKNKMKDWRAAVRTWKGKERENGTAGRTSEPGNGAGYVPGKYGKAGTNGSTASGILGEQKDRARALETTPN